MSMTKKNSTPLAYQVPVGCVKYHVDHSHDDERFIDHCQPCLDEEGKTFTLGTEPKLPRHPNCMCYYEHHGDHQTSPTQLTCPTRLVEHLSLINGIGSLRIPLMKPGRVMAADGSESNWLIPADAIAAAVPLFNGAPVYMDHPGFWDDPKIKDLAGVILAPEYDELNPGLYGTLRLYDEDPNSPGAHMAALLNQMQADKTQGKPVPELGLSATFYADSSMDEESGLRVTTAFRKIISVDFVYSPGARAYLRDALAAIGPGEGPDSTGGQPQRRNMSEQVTPQQSGETPITGVQSPPPAVVPDAVAQRLDAMTATIERLTAALAKQAEPDVIQGLGRAPITSGQMTTGLDQLQAAWDWVFGVEKASPPPPDLRRTDRLYHLLTGDFGWRGVFNQRDALAAATTTTLADMAVNAMNKVIIPLYDSLAAYRWYEMVTTVQPTDGSLHDMAWLTFGGIANLPVVAEGAAYTELTVADAKESDSFVKYGGYVGITEKILRNSEIARIQAIPKALTVAAIRTRSNACSYIFTQATGTGPTLDNDSVVLFHTVTHGNLATTAFSHATWAAARLECYKLTELGSSKRMGMWPKFWLGPADLYDTALEVFGYGQGAGGKPGTGDNTVNVYAEARPGDPRPIPIAVPEFTDVNNWAYLVDPALCPIIQMAYADSPGGRAHPAPELFAVTSPLAGLMFTNDTLPIKVRDHWALGVSDYRGIGKRNVA